MLTVKVKSNVKFPKLNLQSYLKEIADRIIIPDMVKGITSGRSIDGGNFPTNKKKTLERKAKLGQGSRSLIATGELQSDFYSEVAGKNKVVVSINNFFGRKDAGKGLQYPEADAGHAPYRFFGISKDAEDSAVDFIRQTIDEEIENANGS